MPNSNQKAKYQRKSNESYYVDSNQGMVIFVRRSDKAISCSYTYEACSCAKKKQWFNNRDNFWSIHGVSY